MPPTWSMSEIDRTAAMSTYDEIYQRIIAEHDGSSSPRTAADNTLLTANKVATSDLTIVERAALRFVCSSLVTNVGIDLVSHELVTKGKDLALLAMNDTSPDQPLHYQCMYNVANATGALCDFDVPDVGTWEERATAHVESRRTHRVQLRRARTLFFAVATSPMADPHSRSAAYCNLANSLDHSGRWAEAYDFYLRSLEVDPSNGNAAGNLAQLLMARIQSGVGQTGHIAAVYDKYVKMAHDLRDGTVDFAGHATAARWDELDPTLSPGHLSHGLELPVDEYRNWVAENRLALSPAVEGLGTEDPHWDSSVIETLYGSTPEEMSPPIIAEMNVLKSDFLVSRRLAYDGYTDVAAGPEQKADDSGYYVETLDYSLYGLQYSRLFLAQRSALDVLDKTAVVTNEHFAAGVRPHKVSFRTFWATKDGKVRPELVKGPTRALPSYALSELAFDMEPEGMYAPSQALRNAGTHRIVHASLLESTGVTVDARSRVDLDELLDSTVLALQATRSAYLYLIDLVASWNHPEDHPGEFAPFPSFEYSQFDLEGDLSVDTAGLAGDLSDPASGGQPGVG